ncbi:MAG TPA: hypothetical protein VFA65_16130 [Bryobacteraceae bacterium]|nr:hypothetical protein [Bryobacteraceae bacterium]
MNTFPAITSDAVTQYPAAIEYSQGVQVIQFLDGSDQRYLLQPRMLRMWRINLTLLNEDEIQKIESFFAAQQGMYSPFVFADPFTETNVNNCRFAAPELVTSYIDVDNASASCWVIQTNE